MVIDVCCTCGHPVLDPENVLAALTPLQQRVFLAIKRAGQAGIPSPLLMDVVYADDPNGGPVSTNIIAVTANHANKRLERFGLRLVGKPGRGGFYVLRTLEQIDAANG